MQRCAALLIHGQVIAGRSSSLTLVMFAIDLTTAVCCSGAFWRPGSPFVMMIQIIDQIRETQTQIRTKIMWLIVDVLKVKDSPLRKQPQKQSQPVPAVCSAPPSPGQPSAGGSWAWLRFLPVKRRRFQPVSGVRLCS